ncbi:MAG: hypothetical protein PHV74_00815 [Dehalococcoidia bacterium]|nr:hypothetical protein [Dehalococcoidia bacterium]
MAKKSQRKAPAQPRKNAKAKNVVAPKQPLTAEKTTVTASQSGKAADAVPAKAVSPSPKKATVGLAAQGSYSYVTSDIKWLASIMAVMFVLLVVLSYMLK